MGKRSRNRTSITRRRGKSPTVMFRLLGLYPESIGEGQSLDSLVNKFIVSMLSLPNDTLIQASSEGARQT